MLYRFGSVVLVSVAPSLSLPHRLYDKMDAMKINETTAPKLSASSDICVSGLLKSTKIRDTSSARCKETYEFVHNFTCAATQFYASMYWSA